jgi:uncharacterized Zn finger protein
VRAERGRELARAGSVHTVSVRAGEITAQVIGSSGVEYSVGLTADPVPAATWAAGQRSPQGRELVAATLARSPQSIRLEHLMVADWEQPLVPRAWSIVRRCDCADARGEGHTWVCKHVAAAAFVVGEAIDRDVTLLFRWRGCELDARAADPAAQAATAAGGSGPEAWVSGPLPALAAPRPLPRGAVLKRLGRSGIIVGGRDLTELLAPAYDALAGARSE